MHKIINRNSKMDVQTIEGIAQFYTYINRLQATLVAIAK